MSSQVASLVTLLANLRAGRVGKYGSTSSWHLRRVDLLAEVVALGKFLTSASDGRDRLISTKSSPSLSLDSVASESSTISPSSDLSEFSSTSEGGGQLNTSTDFAMDLSFDSVDSKFSFLFSLSELLEPSLAPVQSNGWILSEEDILPKVKYKVRDLLVKRGSVLERKQLLKMANNTRVKKVQYPAYRAQIS
ncbi:hypothetical protein NE237_030390 [Protea cynaroides]|uniref:Uncharacterized protein n=1 Tax=Protea cynaroides TaxID=273540 RepID=A0A9Q0GVU9_9MAGN|nr:hypothetical protein NE237_030390 [Protea cynaroides]